MNMAVYTLLFETIHNCVDQKIISVFLYQGKETYVSIISHN